MTFEEATAQSTVQFTTSMEQWINDYARYMYQAGMDARQEIDTQIADNLADHSQEKMMIMNNITKIDPEAGEFILLSDLGSEGLVVHDQYTTIEAAIKNLGGYGGEPQAIVRLVEVDISIVDPPTGHKQMTGLYEDRLIGKQKAEFKEAYDCVMGAPNSASRSVCLDARIELVAKRKPLFLNELTAENLVARAVVNAKPELSGETNCITISKAFALGSTYSAQLCEKFGIDPDGIG